MKKSISGRLSAPPSRFFMMMSTARIRPVSISEVSDNLPMRLKWCAPLVALSVIATAAADPPKLAVLIVVDQMHRQKGSHVVTLSLKARSAIMLAGHGGDAVTWLSDSLDGWETSTAFSAAPVPEVGAYVSANHIEADFGHTWDRLLPPSRY